MTERELQDAVIECAHTFGWRVAHFRPAKTAQGWRTPVQADGAGFPDLVMVRAGRLIFAELKSAVGRLRPEQRLWIDALAEFTLHMDAPEGPEVYVWKPDRWLDGTIEEALR